MEGLIAEAKLTNAKSSLLDNYWNQLEMVDKKHTCTSLVCRWYM
jgi:hypothetical protein